MAVNPQRLESLIESAYRVIIREESTHDQIKIASLQMAELISHRTPETVEMMERSRGLKSKPNNRRT